MRRRTQRLASASSSTIAFSFIRLFIQHRSTTTQSNMAFNIELTLPLSLPYCLATAAVMIGITYLLFFKVEQLSYFQQYLSVQHSSLACSCSYLFLDSRWSTMQTNRPPFIIGMTLLTIGLVHCCWVPHLL